MDNNRKWHTYYIYGGIKYPSQIVSAPTREVAEMMTKAVEPYLILGDEIIQGSHTEDDNK